MSKEVAQGTIEKPRVAVAPAQGLSSIRRDQRQSLPLGKRLDWLDELLGGLQSGGVYLLAGAPGGRKSGLATQIALELGSAGVRSLTILTEETPQRLQERALLMASQWSNAEADNAIRHVDWDDSVLDLETLPTFLMHNVLNPNGRFAGAKVIILDSIQGDGVPAGASGKYQRFYEFCRSAKSAGITVVAVGHINKRGQLAGPRGLEHHVDAVLQLAKVTDFRVLSLTKNRFGPELTRGFALAIDPVTTILKPSPHIEPVTGVARTYLGSSYGEAEMQASVSLPSPGSRPQIMAPGLPRRRIEQIVAAITRVPSLGLEQFDLNIGALLPGDGNFRAWLGLPLAIALIGSCIRRPVPKGHIYLGEIDLNRAIRPLSGPLLDALSTAMDEGSLGASPQIFVPAASADLITSSAGSIIPCATLDQAVLRTWPDLR